MRPALTRHPDFPSDAVGAIAVEVERRGPFLALEFQVRGATPRLVLPPPAGPLRTGELWRHTCFEAFVRVAGGEGYYEINLSPSTQWAAYRFDGYRTGMTPADEVDDPGVVLTPTEGGLALEAAVALAGLPTDAPWRVGLAAVIEAADGTRSYWALRHPPGRPDFHQPDCFALELPAGQDT